MNLVKFFGILALICECFENRLASTIDNTIPTIDNTSKCTKAGYFLFQKSYYKYHSNAQTWFNASQTCIKEGGHLVIVNTQDEASLLIGLMQQHPADSVCKDIGSNCSSDYIFTGFQKQIFYTWNGTYLGWITVDGQPIKDLGYDLWASGSLNQLSGQEEYCGTFYRYGGLKNFPCYYKQHFVCEIPANACKDNKSLKNPDLKMESTSKPILQERIERRPEWITRKPSTHVKIKKIKH